MGSAPEPPEARRQPDQRPAVERSVTIHHVAREAGVAASTVSRTFTNPQRVNVRTREHVLTVADRLGYRPAAPARPLPPSGTGTLALFVPDIANPYFFGLIRGAERQASAAGYTLILSDTEESPELEARHLERLAKAVDGFVLAATRLPERRIRELSKDHVLTLVNREVEGAPSVVVDNEDGTRQIVEHLVSLGHRSITYLAGPRASWVDARRWQALRAAARRMGVSAGRLGPFPPSVDGGAAAADAAVAHGATALVAFNDLLAIGVLRRFAERGVSVPRDVSVVGYDDIFGSDFCSPPLTTLAAPIQDAGRSAVSLLLEMLDTRGPASGRRRVVLPVHLRIRASSGPARLPPPDPGDRAPAPGAERSEGNHGTPVPPPSNGANA